MVVLLKPIVAFAISSPWTLFAPLALTLQPEGSFLRYAPSFASVEISNTVAVANVGSASLLIAGWLAAVWAAGIALLLGRMLVGYGVIWKLRRRARVYSTGYLFNVLQQARRALQVNAYIGVATSAVVRSPIVMGIFRLLIVIPAELLDKLRADELKLVLIHELAHVRRLYNLTLLLQRLVAAVLFFSSRGLAVWAHAAARSRTGLRRSGLQRDGSLANICLWIDPCCRTRAFEIAFKKENSHAECICRRRVGFGAAYP